VGNGFPGLAVVFSIALLVALGVGALAILQPWEAGSVAPQLSVTPGAKVGLGESAVVSRDQRLAVAAARPATGASPRFVADGAVAEVGESQPRLAIAPARAVASQPPVVPPQSPPPPPQSEPIPAPQSPPVPVSVPVATQPPAVEPVAATPAPGSGAGTPGPIAGGGAVGGGAAELLQVCEGDDYTLPLSPQEAAEGSEVPPPLITHDLAVYFGSSGEGIGFHLVLFDGQPVDIGEDAVPTEPGRSCAQIDLGPLLGESIEAGTELHVEAVTLGEELEPVVP
jgi:hypothetical protein